METQDIWSEFKKKFVSIMQDPDINDYYYKLYNFLQQYENNVLLYGAPGFPTDLFIDEVLKAKFDLNLLHKSKCTWICQNTSSTTNKDMIYYHNPHFLEINLMHHTVEKNTSELSKFFTDIIKNRNINSSIGQKHFIIIKHIDLLEPQYFTSYRIILERFSTNAYFLCTAHNIAKIDTPIKSRFSLMRLPLFTQDELIHIFNRRLDKPLLGRDVGRNIMKALYFYHFNDENTTLNFPPIIDLFKMKKTDIKLEDIRHMAYKCFQYNVTIPELTTDILKLLPKNTKQKKKFKIINAATDFEHKLHLIKRGREPIYIEAFLCQVFI